MSNLTREQIERIFAESRERQAKLREREAQKKAAERLRKKRVRQRQAELEKEAQRAKEEAELEAYRARMRSDVLPSRLIIDDKFNNVYTKEELMCPELIPNETGRINWTAFWKSVDETKKLIENSLQR